MMQGMGIRQSNKERWVSGAVGVLGALAGVAVVVQLAMIAVEAAWGASWARPVALAMFPVWGLVGLAAVPLFWLESRIDRDKQEEEGLQHLHRAYARNLRVANADRLPPVERAMEFYGSYMRLLADVHVLGSAYPAHRGVGAREFDGYYLERILGYESEHDRNVVALSILAEEGLIAWGGRAWSPISITDLGLVATRRFCADEWTGSGRNSFPLSDARTLTQLKKRWADDLPEEVFFDDLPEEEQGLIRWLAGRPKGANSLTLDRVFEDSCAKKLDVLWDTKMKALGLLEEAPPGRMEGALGLGALPRVRVSAALSEELRGPSASRR